MANGIRRSFSLASLGLLLALTLAACGTVSESVPPTVTRVDAPGAPPTYTPTPEGGAAPAATPQPAASPAASGDDGGGAADNGGDGGASAVEIDMEDIMFAPAEMTIPANTDVTITLNNKGALQHEFKIDDQNIDSGLVDGGGSTTVKVNLPPGTYTYHCPVPGHTEAGMTGTLTVQ